MMIPYVAGISEDGSHICRKFGFRVVFKSGYTLRSILTRLVKDKLPMEKKSMVVKKILCSCGNFYIGETRRRLETRMKERQDACKEGLLKSQPLRNMHGKMDTQLSGRKPW